MNDMERSHARLARQGHADTTRELQTPAHARHPVKHRKPKAPIAAVEQPWFVRLFTGVHVDPMYTGAARALLSLGLTAGINLLIGHYHSIPPWGQTENFAIIFTLLTGAQGIVDKLLKGDASAAGAV